MLLEVTHRVWLISSHPIPKTVAGAGTAGGAAASGWEAAGSIGGLVSAFIALCALAFGIAWNNRQNRNQYNEEIAAAKEEGRTEIRLILEQVRVDSNRRIDAANQDMYFWRGIALGRIQGTPGSLPVPIPPSEQPPHRLVPIPDPEPGEGTT